jgi:hypothetical protein
VPIRIDRSFYLKRENLQTLQTSSLHFPIPPESFSPGKMALGCFWGSGEETGGQRRFLLALREEKREYFA